MAGQKCELLVRELELIKKIDSIRDKTTDMQKMLVAAASAIIDELDMDLCSIVLVDEYTGKLELRTLDDRCDLFKRSEAAFIKELAREALDSGKMLVWGANDVKIKKRQIKGMVAAPLFIDNRGLGAVVLAKCSAELTQDQIALLSAAIDQLDSAVEHAFVFHQLELRNKELETVYRIDHLRDSVDDFQNMLDAVLVELCRVISAEMGFIMLYDEQGKKLEMRVSTDHDIFAEQYHLVEKIAKEAVQIGEVIKRTNLTPRLHSMICVPLILSEKIIGVVGVINSAIKVEFDVEDERLLRAITSQVDTAIFESLDKRRIRSFFSRYVSPNVVEMMLTMPEKDFFNGKRAVLTVLFSDMRGFTSMSERTDAQDLVDVLNEHLAAMSNVILSNQGTVDKFVGDEVMAVFGAPIAQTDHALLAVKTALEMQEAHQKLMCRWEQQKCEAIPIGIGINTGEMVVGNIGSPQKTSYTTIGDQVNLGARLCSAAEGGQILMSDSTYRLVKDAVKVNKLPAIHVKGKADEIQIYEVLGLK